LVSSFSGSKQIVPRVENDKKWSLFAFPLKCHHVLHLVLEFEIVVHQLNDEFFCFDIKMTIGISEPTKDLVNRELQMFWRYQIDAKTLSVLWSGGENMSPCFQLLFPLPIKFSIL
jgi:hypothetical protein